MKYSTTIYLILSLLGLGYAQEDSITIQGNVKGITGAGDTINLPRASIFIEGTEYGARADTNSNFSFSFYGNINEYKGKKLIFRYPRRQMKVTITLDSLNVGANNFCIVLKEDLKLFRGGSLACFVIKDIDAVPISLPKQDKGSERLKRIVDGVPKTTLSDLKIIVGIATVCDGITETYNIPKRVKLILEERKKWGHFRRSFGF